MLFLLRRIRHKLVQSGQIKTYLAYAIGEIILVVAGILIAIQIDSWNDAMQEEAKANRYRAALLTELKLDLNELDRIDSNSLIHQKKIFHYLEAYNRQEPVIDTLVLRISQLDYEYSNFQTQTYSIEEILTSGNLPLLEEKERHAILRLRATQQKVQRYYEEGVTDILNYTKAVNDEIDVLNLYGYSSKEHKEVRNWIYDVDSKQFRLYNNELAAILRFYQAQAQQHQLIRSDIKDLMDQL